MGSGLVSAWRLVPLAECRAPQPHGQSRRRPAPSFPRYIKLQQAVCWMRHGFPLAFNSQITLSWKRKTSWGSKAAVKLSIVEQGTESEAPRVFESFAVVAPCLPSLPLNIPGQRAKIPLQPMVVDGDILLTQMLLHVFLAVECVECLVSLSSVHTRSTPRAGAAPRSPVRSALPSVFAAGALRCLGERLGGNFKSFQRFDGDWVNPSWIHSYLRSFYKLQRAGWLKWRVSDSPR